MMNDFLGLQINVMNKVRRELKKTVLEATQLE